MSWPGIATSRDYFYHYTPHILDRAAAIGLLWTNLPKGQQMPKPGGIPLARIEVPLSAFSEPTLRSLAQWFESTGTPAARHPVFLNYLKQSARLVVKPENNRLVKAAIVFDDRTTPLSPELLPILTISLDR